MVEVLEGRLASCCLPKLCPKPQMPLQGLGRPQGGYTGFFLPHEPHSDLWVCPKALAQRIKHSRGSCLGVENKNPLSGLCPELPLVLPHCPAIILGWLQLPPGFTTGSRRRWSLSCDCVAPGELLHLSGLQLHKTRDLPPRGRPSWHPAPGPLKRTTLVHAGLKIKWAGCQYAHKNPESFSL